MNYRDPKDIGNSETYKTGKPCIEEGCEEVAGTAWSRLWCVQHNIERMDRISAFFNGLTRRSE